MKELTPFPCYHSAGLYKRRSEKARKTLVYLAENPGENAAAPTACQGVETQSSSVSSIYRYMEDLGRKRERGEIHGALERQEIQRPVYVCVYRSLYGRCFTSPEITLDIIG